MERDPGQCQVYFAQRRDPLDDSDHAFGAHVTNKFVPGNVERLQLGAYRSGPEPAAPHSTSSTS
eukprot:3457898-Prymnesium_polylepis.1